MCWREQINSFLPARSTIHRWSGRPCLFGERAAVTQAPGRCATLRAVALISAFFPLPHSHIFFPPPDFFLILYASVLQKNNEGCSARFKRVRKGGGGGGGSEEDAAAASEAAAASVVALLVPGSG